MEEALNAFKNPTWWILTVVVGLLLNVLAPFINRSIESAWASRSKKRREEVERLEGAIKVTVDRLSTKPDGLIEAKLDVIYWCLRIILTLTIYLLLVQIIFSIPVLLANAAAAPIAVLGFLNIAGHWQKWSVSRRIHNLVEARVVKGEGEGEA